MDKATTISYFLQRLSFCEGIWRTGIKVKESADWMEKIPSTIVVHKYVDRVDTIFSTMAGPLVRILWGVDWSDQKRGLTSSF